MWRIASEVCARVPNRLREYISVFEIKRNWWSPKLKAGVRGSSPRKNFKFKVAKPPEI